MPLREFHPAVAGWFASRFGEPTEPQAAAWPSIRAGRHTLIAAPTGSGKTLAAFLASIDELVRESLRSGLTDQTRIVYVSPLKALSNDIQRNLEEPLAGVKAELTALGLPEVEIRPLVRTGDTPSSERSAMTRRPPHILVTTPESLYILLTSEGGARMLSTTRMVIVDEIHAVAGNKRGSHLSLSLERLEALTAAAGRRVQRVGLSATQRPIEKVARFLVGSGGLAGDGTADCAIVDVGHRRDLDLAIELPGSPLEAVLSGEGWNEIYDLLAERIREHRTTLVFVNTRRLAERVTRHLAERLGDEHVASHHGSLSREQRLTAEQRLKNGNLRALVATASLELGIDIGSVELVCTIGTTRSIATLLQRVGRSGHRLTARPKGRLFPTTRDELVECAALLDAVGRGELEALEIPEKPLDILAQQIVAAVASREWGEEELFGVVCRAWPFRDLSRGEFDEVVQMLADGFATRRGRRGAFLHHDAINGRLRARRGARLAAITSGGAIPDSADYRVILEPSGTFLGTVNEDFAIESMAGDIFQLGASSWRIQRVEQGRVLVEDARGEPPSIPFWLGEAPARSAELSAALSRLRIEIGERGQHAPDEARRHWTETGVSGPAGEQIVEYLAASRAALGVLPHQGLLVLERFFDEAGNQHLVIHSPFGSRINRAFGLALRKRFCRKFNFELQAAATEDAIVLSLGPTHSFPLEDVPSFLHASSVRGVLVQALLDAPMFTIRWRWNAGRSLAVLRWAAGRRVPPRLQRMQAEDLVSVVFPDQLACLENVQGERQIPDHPLVRQTIRDCLEEAMDIEGLERLLRALESGELGWVARELREPSPLAHEALNARPYAFLDDAPLEERRTQAVVARRWLDPQSAADLGKLDAAAIDRVRREAWPEVTTADELHDALYSLCFLTAEEGAAEVGWTRYLEVLIQGRRATRLFTKEGGFELWVAAERLPEMLVLYPEATLEPAVVPPARHAGRAHTPHEALVELLRGRLEASGPVTADDLSSAAGLDRQDVEVALAVLEAQGFAMRGHFTPQGTQLEWCERRLLARIHRQTLDRLRREIQPVSQADFMRFLLGWQRVDPEERAKGPESLATVLEQLEGFEAPAAAWEGEILPARLDEYDPIWLDALCLSGRFVWGRASVRNPSESHRTGPIRTTPTALLSREKLAAWNASATERAASDPFLSPAGRTVLDLLERRGASFFADLAAGTGLLRTQVEDGLGELVIWGLVTSDSFTGLRALLTPSSRRPAIDGRSKRSAAVFGIENAGRWSVLRRVGNAADGAPATGSVETIARVLLRRYGVVFRTVLQRESLLPPWRELLCAYRRLEARGEIRGGRFVDGFAGEQFALPDAIARLREVRRKPAAGTDVSISAADPLNLLGVTLPGERVAAHAGNRILYRDGIPLAIRESGEVRFLAELTAAELWHARNVLLRRRVPAQLRAYLGRPA